MSESTQPDDDALEAGRLLFAGTCDFVAGAADIESLPPPRLDEVAFIGRSNVGKSSLINALTGRKALARISSTPGRTQQINFFDLGHRLMLVDLPGYGYSRAGKAKARNWSRLIELYLKGRATLRRVLVLVDARRGLGPADRDMMALLDEAAVSYQIVLTKIDAVARATGGNEDAAAVIDRISRDIARRPAAHPEIMATSARDGTGIPALRAVLAMVAGPGQLG